MFLAAIVLIVVGLLAIYSSTYNHPTAKGNFNKQLVFAVVSIVIFFIVYFLPARTFRVIAIPTFLLSLGLLVAVVFMGKTVYGAKSWMSLGPIGFQPSEFAKIGTILFLAHWLSSPKRDINNLKELFYTITLSMVPIMLILMEPDMGTAIVYISITLMMIFWSGISLFGLFVVVSPGVILFASLFGTPMFLFALASVIIALFLFKQDLFTSGTVFVINLAAGFAFELLLKVLKPHQVNRILTFVDPSSDPLGSGYNALQAKVAIGSGGLVGKGFMQGNQTQLRFIPEQWTDFIYCVVGEEFGFIGSVIVLVLFLIIFLRLLNFTSHAGDKFDKLVVVGILALFFIHFAINIGMNLGITPVIGLPLPLVSYGGSALITNMLLLGITFNIYKNRKYHA
ncbi:Rod shape-determining protein RodA [hydrothermal vent metagenome]|uniref:Rod shape-determining protein RodA n=1 Tax=hydrothermal vent metagenome TaxID=652676 RepID=A0A3B1BJ09_9ZZZZ